MVLGELTEAWCAVKALWPNFVVDVGWDDGQVRIAIDAEVGASASATLYASGVPSGLLT